MRQDLALRYQNDGRNDEISKATRFDFSQPVIVRPEFGPESDTKNILKRYAGIGIPQKQPTYAEIHYDEDLTTAMTAIRRAHQAFDKLPKDLREKYETPENLFANYREEEQPAPVDTETKPSETTGSP